MRLRAPKIIGARTTMYNFFKLVFLPFQGGDLFIFLIGLFTLTFLFSLIGKFSGV